MSTMVAPYTIIRLCTVICHKAEEGGYWGEVLELPGCVSQGETIDEFTNNIREALKAVLESESQTPPSEIYTEPTLAKFIQFRIPESRKEKAHWVEASEALTAAA